jgi:hypothetical protein
LKVLQASLEGKGYGFAEGIFMSFRLIGHSSKYYVRSSTRS